MSEVVRLDDRRPLPELAACAGRFVDIHAEQVEIAVGHFRRVAEERQVKAARSERIDYPADVEPAGSAA